MKSILVVDTPKNCSECKLMYLQGIGESICNAVDWEERPSWCPLKPFPQEREFGKRNILPIKVDGNSFTLGWNACLKEITK